MNVLKPHVSRNVSQVFVRRARHDGRGEHLLRAHGVERTGAEGADERWLLRARDVVE